MPYLCDKRQAALALHDRGLWVVPCHGKAATKMDWPNVRVEREELEEILSENDQLDIAIVLNQSDWIDVEHDQGEEGEAALLKQFGGKLPPTPTYRSPRGFHRLFLRPGGLPNKAKIEFDDIEYRIANGKGALSIVPPSSGRSWETGLSLEEVEPANLPDDIVARLRTPDTKPGEERTDGNDIPEGYRNESLFAIGCAMRRHGCSDESIRKALDIENTRRCKPQLSTSEVKRIAQSAVAYDCGELFDSFNLFKSPRLASAAYHGFVGELAETIDPYTEAPAAGIIAQSLAATGMLVGDGPNIFAGTAQPARVNVVLAGHTSLGRKGTAASVVDGVLRRLTDSGLRSLWQFQCVRGLSSGEGLINAVADHHVQNEKSGKLELVRVEKRLFVIEPEFAKVLAHGRREGNILSHILREAFDSGHLQTLTRESPLRADGAHIVVVGHITPDELRKRLTELEMANGFANRFLWVYVESEKMLPDAPPVPDELLDGLAQNWSEILLAAQKITRLERDDEASELWRLVYPELRTPRSGLRGAILARAETIVTRLALLYALLDKSQIIRRVHLEAALAVWQYSVESVRLLFPDKTGDSVADRLHELMENGPMTKTDMYKHIAEPADVLDAALAGLEAAGRVRKSPRTQKGRGRPSEVFERVGG